MFHISFHSPFSSNLYCTRVPSIYTTLAGVTNLRRLPCRSPHICNLHYIVNFVSAHKYVEQKLDLSRLNDLVVGILDVMHVIDDDSWGK